VLKRESGNETVFRYDGGNAFQEHRDGAMSVEFVRGTGLGGGIGSILYSDRSVDPNGGGAVEFNVYNPVGHVVVQTDPSGNLVNASMYEAFGNIVDNHKTGEQGNRLASTKERDVSIGLDNHGFRYYDPEIGRYISRDPIGYGDGLNPYLYVHNNPINHIDPLGLFSWRSFAKGALKGAAYVAVGVVVVGVVAATGGAAGVAIAGAMGASAATAATVGTAVSGTVAGAATVYGSIGVGKSSYEALSGNEHKWDGSGNRLSEDARSEAAGEAFIGLATVGLGAKKARSQRTRDQQMVDNLVTSRSSNGTSSDGTLAQGASVTGKKTPVTASKQNPANPEGRALIHAEPQVIPNSRGGTVAVDQFPCPSCGPKLRLNGVRAIVPQTPSRAPHSPKSAVGRAVKKGLPVKPREAVHGPEPIPLSPPDKRNNE